MIFSTEHTKDWLDKEEDPMKRNCENCKHFWEDRSVNYFECTNCEITENEMERYFENGEDNCPRFEERIDVDYPM
jgi:Zn finger protein HypA/HybF involved in hydrogenase expression